ncbi:unnamed protein product, partial [Rotaria sp. Silwood2]
LESVASGCSIRDAANTFNVPYTTLNSHVNTLVLYEEVGRPTKFTKLEEEYLEQAALILQEWGQPLTIDEFLNLAKQYAASLNKSQLFPSGAPTYDWFRSFLKRHQNFVLKKSRPLEKKRASITMEQVDGWFDLLYKIIQDNNLVDRPGQVFNCDETGLSDCISYSKVLVRRQTHNAFRSQGGTGGKAYTSLMFCVSATGYLLPPFVIYKSKRLYQEWCSGGPPDTGYSNSENGWIDQQLFYEWFDQIFLQRTKDLPRPLVLIVDGHGSHFKVETLRLAVQNEVILKSEYNRTQNKNISKAQFPSLLKQLWITDALNRKTNIIKSFMKAGVFPLNRRAIDVSRILRSNTSTATASSTTDMNQNNKTNNVASFTTSQPLSSPPPPVASSSFSSTTFDSSSFNTSQLAISTLNQVLDETTLEDSLRDKDEDDIDVDMDENDDEDDDSDESYVPESFSSNIRTKRKRSSSETTRLDTSDDGNSNG